ncbi:MAG: hypothetical protein CMD54_04250 [Gammaproteobacteria bacterium]|nr:hypothetical protein [Gammaproteobacteria bacterium]HAN80239.1 hypothetical protein [Gammaproteobacteria bacterium]
MHLNKITILVHDIDAAVQFFRDALGLKLIEDSLISESKRIVCLATSDSRTAFNITKPKHGDEFLVGRQAGDRVFVFMDTSDLNRDMQRFQHNRVAIFDGPRTEDFGRCVIIKDLVGNKWELVERRLS